MESREEIMAWRRAERERQIDARMALSVAQRQEASARIIGRVDAWCRTAALLAPGVIVSGYWPLRGEPDMRPWLASLVDAGLTCALPVVVEKGAPLQFRAWTPGCAMEKGFWGIPVPAAATPVTPDILLAPVVGFDPANFRLGYGGGYFDRTLEQMRGQGLRYHAIGVGYAMARLETIRPLAHDIALDTVITD
jgi:5-formyltetrahydrofolate cyclo-ligase